MPPNMEELQAPSALRDLKGWLVWKMVQKHGRPKPSKMPYYVKGGVRNGEMGSPEDRAKMVTFDEAKAFAAKHGYHGVGFALMPEFGITGLDFDDCVVDGVVDPQVEALTEGTYAEFSPSGRGIRAFLKGSIPDDKDSPPKNPEDSFGYEVFSTKGFLTFTGNVLDTIKILGEENLIAPVRQEHLDFGLKRFVRVSQIREKYEGDGKPVLGVSEEQIETALSRLPEDLSYDEWIKVGMAVHHETMGEGFAIWDEWSSKSPKYTSTEYSLERWQSFGHNQSAEYATIKSIVKMAKDLGVDSGINIDTASAAEFPMLAPEVKKPAKVGTFNIRKHTDFMQQVRSVRWIVKDFLPHATLGVLFGESGSGKSFLGYDLCAAIVRGEEWNGKRVTKGRVLYIVAEGQAGFVNRGKAYVHQQGIQHSELDDMDYITDRVPNLISKEITDELIADIKQQEPYDLIVMDTFAQVTTGANENSGQDMGIALGHCRRIGQVSGAMVLLVHHSGKDASKGARGWSGLRAAADVELEVIRSDEIRSVTVTKLKDGQDGVSIGFKLHTVVLGEDEDGDDVTSCIIEYTEGGRVKAPGSKRIGKNELAVLKVVHDMCGLEAGGKVQLEALLDKVVAETVEPGRNTRGNANRSLKALAAKNSVFMAEGCVSLPESNA